MSKEIEVLKEISEAISRRYSLESVDAGDVLNYIKRIAQAAIAEAGEQKESNGKD